MRESRASTISNAQLRMLTPRPDLEERVIAAMESGADAVAAPQLPDPFEYVATANYTVPMLVDLAIKLGNETVDVVPRWSSLDHAVIWTDLLAAIARFDTFVAPYFSESLVADPFAEELLRYEHAKLSRQHLIESLQGGLWSIVEDEHGPRIHIAERVRRSALHLLAGKANSISTPEPARAVWDDPDQTGADLALGAGIHDLRVFSDSCPAAWADLAAGLPFPVAALPAFRAFALTLAREASTRWSPAASLRRHWKTFTESIEAEVYDEAAFDALLAVHSVTVSEAREWGVQAPFLRFGDIYLAWHFVYHVLPPDLNFHSLLTRRYGQLWSKTVGSELDRVGDWLGGQLTARDRLRWVARRRRTGVGDVDLALLDLETGYVLTLELKTVFDKFRTHIQLTNYAHQRVNFTKAIKQAQAAADALQSGAWPLRDIFGRSAPKRPTVVTPGVVTWWDTYNPTLGTTDPILCCNFDTFIYVMNNADGHVAAAVDAIRQLSTVYCPGTLVPYLTFGEDRLHLRREVQGELLPPIGDLEKLGLSQLARSLVDDLPAWTGDALDQATADGYQSFRYEVDPD